MKINLIPVLDIGYNNQGIKIPDKHPYWKYPDIWYEYRKQSLKKAGFKDELEPYLKGSSFFEPKKITDENLQKIVIDHTEGFRSGEWERIECTCLFGGYVLRIEEEDKFFPQCCGDLGDIKYWERVSKGVDAYYEGHPAPYLKFKSTKIIFDFSVNKQEEDFLPPPINTLLEIDKQELIIAVENAKSELKKLTHRVKKINKEMNLGIDKIEDLLIWESPNQE